MALAFSGRHLLRSSAARKACHDGLRAHHGLRVSPTLGGSSAAGLAAPGVSQIRRSFGNAACRPLRGSRTPLAHPAAAPLLSLSASGLPSSLWQPRLAGQQRQFATAGDWSNDSVPLERRRNIAIIAHVDHGKTTMVDALLRQSNLQQGKENKGQRVMDNNALEQERGITILSKCTSLLWTPQGEEVPYLFNIVDTPGHADFGGEVERIMSMVDGVALVVCALEGPMPQTKYVLGKALKAGLKPIVIINKVDRPGARPAEVEGEVFDLFADLGATEEQMEFPTLYASGRDGWCNTETTPRKPGEHDVNAFFETAAAHVSAPHVEEGSLEKPFQMLVTQVDMHPHFGRILIGRVNAGHLKVNDVVHALAPDGSVQESNCRVLKLLARRGMDTIYLNEARPGDICMVAAGFQAGTVNSTLGLPSMKQALPSHPIDPPTLSVMVGPNTSPLVGRDGKGCTSLEIKSYLKAEAEINVSIQVFDHSGDSIELRGRGELQIGVVVETMRRLGMELSLSPPRVVYMRPKPGQDVANTPVKDLALEAVMSPTSFKDLFEPLEEVVVDIPQGDAGVVMEKLSMRKAEVVNFVTDEGSGRTRMTFHIPTRCLLGYHGDFVSDTKGQGIIYNTFHSYVEYQGELPKQTKGALIARAPGKTTQHALEALQARGVLFVGPGEETYEGMVVGECSKDESLDVNPVREKQLSNIRTVSREGITRLTPPIRMSLEQMIVYCRPDEIIEVTPKNIRLRKLILSASERQSRSKK